MSTPAPRLKTANDLPLEARTACEVWTRVMGYHRPVSSFNAGKKSEHRERRFFTCEKAMQGASHEA